MWIRCQERILIQKVSSVFISENLVCTEDTVGEIPLGTYESSERAVAVLDMIHQHINNYQYSIITGEHFVSKIFVMPEK